MNKHEEATKALAEGRTQEALVILEDLIAEHETSELWNDWATVQFVRTNVHEAECGFSKALALDPGNHQARMNLGLLHWNLGNREAAKPLLERALPFVSAQEQQAIRNLLLQLPAAQTASPDQQDGASLNATYAGGPPSGGTPSLRILVIHDTFPHRNLASDQRVMQLLAGLAGLGHRVTFIGRDAMNRSRYEAPLQELDIECYGDDVVRMRPLGEERVRSSWSLDQLLEEKNFDVAILSQNFARGLSITEQYLDEIRAHSPSTRIMVLADCLRGRALLRQAKITGKIEDLEWGNDLAQREMEGLERADMTLAANRCDAEYLRSILPGSNIGLFANTGQPVVARRAVEEHHGVLFAGDLANHGAAEGLAWFLKAVWPIVRSKEPSIELLLAIENVPLDIQKLLAGLHWSGGRDLPRFAETARLFVSPIRFGVNAANVFGMLATGIPGVVTSAGLEATGLTLKTGILGADSPADFADTILVLYDDLRLREEISVRGREYVELNHSPEAQRTQLAEAINRLRQTSPKAGYKSPASMILIETLYAGMLEQKSGQERMLAQLDCYVQLAEQLLRERKPQEALVQARHVFGRLTGTVHRGVFLSQVLTLLKRCYRELGQAELADRCAREARLCAATQAAATAISTGPAIRSGMNKRVISLIVPTFNRLPILKKCLAALEVQTMPKDDFEVIVIDDGSSDGTEEAIQHYRAPYPFLYLRQNNSGTGTARCNGVNHAQGEYLLLMNDDSIFEKDVLEQHLRTHRSHNSGKWAVLGNFQYPPAEARKRALTHFFCVEPFMFPQIVMEEGCPYGYSHFITCNLSVHRAAVVEAGSFDPIYKLSEDTELGIRLYERGYRVLFHPAAHSWHDHLPYAIPNLIRRARVYGADYFYMFGRHPRVLKEWALPVNLTGMDEENAYKIFDYVERNRPDVENSVAALQRWDNVDFVPILEKDPSMANLIMQLFKQALPSVHWFYLLETMLNTMKAELGLTNFGVIKTRLPMANRSLATQAGGTQ